MSKKVFIEPVASSSDFSEYINSQEDLEFDSDRFWDDMKMFDEDTTSSRFSQTFCQEIIDGKHGKYWDSTREYYPVLLKFMKEYNLETIRFKCDW